MSLAYYVEYAKKVVPKNVTWFLKGNNDKEVKNFEESPRENVFVYWEKVTGEYGECYKMLSANGKYYWSNNEITHWLDANMCDIENECLCTKKTSTGKVVCGKCPKTEEYRRVAEAFSMVINDKV